jgi:hypothetical protein
MPEKEKGVFPFFPVLSGLRWVIFKSAALLFTYQKSKDYYFRTSLPEPLASSFHIYFDLLRFLRRYVRTILATVSRPNAYRDRVIQAS